jgi:putative membrane protein
VNFLVLAVVLGATPLAVAQTQSPTPPTDNPSSASSPHQRAATKQTGTAEAPANASPEAASGASPHQEQAVGEGSNGSTGGKKMSDKSAADPATFVRKAALGGMTEVETSKLAATKAQDPQVRSFAQKMVTDHSAANEELKALAQKKGLMVPTSLDPEHQAIVQKLSSKSGAEFDSAYSKQMMKDHEKTVKLFKGASHSSDTDIAAWAQKTLPTLEQHDQLAAQLPGATHSASAHGAPQRQ